MYPNDPNELLKLFWEEYEAAELDDTPALRRIAQIAAKLFSHLQDGGDPPNWEAFAD